MTHKRKILTVVLLAGAQLVAAAAPVTASPNTPVSDEKQPKWRLDLRADLYRAGAEKAKSELPRFRALCDAEGYPLVGNIANKGMRHDVNAMCGDVRAKLAQSPKQ